VIILTTLGYDEIPMLRAPPCPHSCPLVTFAVPRRESSEVWRAEVSAKTEALAI